LGWFSRKGSQAAAVSVAVREGERDGKPLYELTIDGALCEGCGDCARVCRFEIIMMVKERARVTGDMTLCNGCEVCVAVCERGGITLEEC